MTVPRHVIQSTGAPSYLTLPYRASPSPPEGYSPGKEDAHLRCPDDPPPSPQRRREWGSAGGAPRAHALAPTPPPSGSRRSRLGRLAWPPAEGCVLQYVERLRRTLCKAPVCVESAGRRTRAYGRSALESHCIVSHDIIPLFGVRNRSSTSVRRFFAPLIRMTRRPKRLQIR